MASPFSLPAGFDPAKIMALLASLPKEEQVRLLDGTKDKVDEFMEHARSRKGLTKRFKEARAKSSAPVASFRTSWRGARYLQAVSAVGTTQI
jgi:hypothetical protein